eukprot:SAG31_NODE_332_length_17516_cov_3.552840_3_plen_83_part_00
MFGFEAFPLGLSANIDAETGREMHAGSYRPGGGRGHMAAVLAVSRRLGFGEALVVLHCNGNEAHHLQLCKVLSPIICIRGQL